MIAADTHNSSFTAQRRYRDCDHAASRRVPPLCVTAGRSASRSERRRAGAVTEGHSPLKSQLPKILGRIGSSPVVVEQVEVLALDGSTVFDRGLIGKSAPAGVDGLYTDTEQSSPVLVLRSLRPQLRIENRRGSQVRARWLPARDDLATSGTPAPTLSGQPGGRTCQQRVPGP